MELRSFEKYNTPENVKGISGKDFYYEYLSEGDRDTIIGKISELKKSENPSIRLHMQKVNICELKDADLMMFRQLYMETPLKEKIKEFDEYTRSLMKELKNKYSSDDEIFENSRLNLQMMLKNYLSSIDAEEILARKKGLIN